MHPWRWLPVAVLIMSALLAFGGTASCGQNVRETAAASLSEVAERQDDLKSLRSQIDTLRKEMTSAEGSRRDAIDQLQGELRRRLLKALQIEETRGRRLVPRKEMLQNMV